MGTGISSILREQAHCRLEAKDNLPPLCVLGSQGTENELMFRRISHERIDAMLRLQRL